MADKMGNKTLDSTANELKNHHSPQNGEIKPSTYVIVKYQGSSLPEEFINLIRGPFFTTLRDGNDYFKLIDRDAYYEAYNRYFELILRRPNTIIRIAHLNDEFKTALGWSIIEDSILHYVWVKSDVRRTGIGKSLVPSSVETISHVTKKGISIWASKYPKWRFNPFV